MQRRLRRFFSKIRIPSEGECFSLMTDETRHLARSIRLKAGDRCLVADSSGEEAECMILRFSADETAVLKVERKVLKSQELSGLVLKAYVAIPQRGKMDALMEKAQELGVAEVVPVLSERTVVRPAAREIEKVIARWQKILQEAAKQSGMTKLVHVRTPRLFQHAMEEIPANECLLFFHPCPEAVPVQSWLFRNAQNRKVSVLHYWIGPEGGFSSGELSRAQSRGAVVLTLGGHLLKVDTAFCSITSVLKWGLPFNGEGVL